MSGIVRAALKVMRPRQWVKNGFLFVPLFFGAELASESAYAPLAVAFICFCLISSAVYILNDICDAGADRKHQTKRLRPIASGAISPLQAGVVGLVLLGSGLLAPLTVGLPPAFYGIVASYLFINIAYSLGLKHIAVLELFMVSSGFVLRLLAGGIVAQISLSPWIIVATGMISLLLATGKRRADLALDNDPGKLRRSLQGYTVEYLDAVLAAIAGGTFIVFILFCASDYAIERYGRAVLVTSVPVGLGVLRFVQAVMVHNGGDSPTDLVLRDRFILTTVAVFVLLFAILLYV